MTVQRSTSTRSRTRGSMWSDPSGTATCEITAARGHSGCAIVVQRSWAHIDSRQTGFRNSSPTLDRCDLWTSVGSHDYRRGRRHYVVHGTRPRVMNNATDLL